MHNCGPASMGRTPIGTQTQRRKPPRAKKVCKRCSSDKHSLPTHHLCPNNKSITHNMLPPDADEESDTSLMFGPYSNLYDEVDTDMLDDNAVSGCDMKSSNKRMPSKPQKLLRSQAGEQDTDPVTKSACNEEATRLFREDKMDLDKAESKEESAPSRFKLGDHLHIQVPGKDGHWSPANATPYSASKAHSPSDSVPVSWSQEIARL